MLSIIRLLLLLQIFFLASCGDLTESQTEQVHRAMNDSLITTAETWDVSMSLLEEGNQRILLEGSYAIDYREEETEKTRIDGPVYVQIFDSTGSLESEAWSQRALYYADDREFELFDSVRVESVAERQLFSDYLKWTEQTDRITSDHLVTIITPSDSISGTGFTGKTDLSNYVIANPRGRVVVD